jgi:excisionase family DNA binding protein
VTASVEKVWFTVEEASVRTGVGRTEIYEALQVGELTGFQRHGKKSRWRIHVEDLDAWMRGAIRGVA